MSPLRRSLLFTVLLVVFCAISFLLLPKSYAKLRYQTTPALSPITASDGAAIDQFGYAVAVDSGTILVGADKADANGNRSGTAYVYTETTGGWSQQAKLIVDDINFAARFGSAVDIDGDTAIVGAHQDDNDETSIPGTGSVHMFVRNGTVWSYQAEVNSGVEAGGWFGYAVGIDGETIVVGAPTETHNDISSGAAYVFTRNGTTWTREAILIGDDVTDSALLGTAVAISQDTVVIGARNQRAAYVFTRSGTTWTQEAKLIGDGQGGNSLFGVSVALDGDTILVGDHWYDAGAGPNQGTVYVFSRTGTTWTQQQKLVAGSAAQDDWFGFNLDVRGDLALIGAPGRMVGSNSLQGAAFLFVNTGASWAEQQEWEVTDGLAEDYFGNAIGVDEDIVVIGAPYRDVTANNDQGAVYVAQLPKQNAIAFAPLPNRLLSDAPFALTATASSGLPVTFSTSTETVCTITATTVTLLAAGQCTITASQSGDDEFPPAPDVTHSFMVITPVTSVHLPLIFKSSSTH